MLVWVQAVSRQPKTFKGDLKQCRGCLFPWWSLVWVHLNQASVDSFIWTTPKNILNDFEQSETQKVGKTVDSYNRNGTVSFRDSLHTCLPSGKNIHIPKQCNMTRGKKWHKTPVFSLDILYSFCHMHCLYSKSPGKTNTALQSTLKDLITWDWRPQEAFLTWNKWSSPVFLQS